MKAKLGLTMIELLIAVAVVAIILSIAGIGGRDILRSRAEQNSVATVQQAFLQGATTASARGIVIELIRNNNELLLRRQTNQQIIRRFELPSTVTSNLPEGLVVRFLPPGEIEESTLLALPVPITVTTSKGGYALSISVVGETRVEAIP